MWFCSNLPDTISAEQIADLYRRRWSIAGMFQRLESVLDSEIETLGSPRAALLDFASVVLAYNVLAVLKRSVERAHRETQPEGRDEPDVPSPGRLQQVLDSRGGFAIFPKACLPAFEYSTVEPCKWFSFFLNILIYRE
jgi:hypothetical protein